MPFHRTSLAIAVALLLPTVTPGAAEIPSPSTETLVIFRHGEKPQPIGYGQLNCAGLNRSLRLPQVFAAHYPRPDKLYAPDPHTMIPDGPTATPTYYYIRPLATIEPLAIQLRMPVDVDFGYDDVDGLVQDLLKISLHDKVVYVAWEHGRIGEIVKSLKKRFGNDVDVPPMHENEYDYIYRFTIDWSDIIGSLSFMLGHEDLKPDPTCPFPASWKPSSDERSR